jgi:hypothetical protein
MATAIEDPKLVRMVSGVEETRAAELLLTLQHRRDLWPYDWVFPPPNYKRVHQEASIAVSSLTPGTQAEVLVYTVPNNYRFMLNGLVQLYVGSSAFTPGDGNVKWDLDVNIPAGVTSPQGYPVQGFSNSGIPKGAYQSGIFAPYPLAPAPEEINPLDQLRSKVTVTAQITTGRVIAIFDGWLLPVLGPR